MITVTYFHGTSELINEFSKVYKPVENTTTMKKYDGTPKH